MKPGKHPDEFFKQYSHRLGQFTETLRENFFSMTVQNTSKYAIFAMEAKKGTGHA
jgi:hypothetical protein